MIVRNNDLTEERTDAIVNPANEYLLYEGGLTKAVADKGGDIVLKESCEYIKLNGKLPTGQAILRNGGNLPSRWVIHAVGPKYNKGSPDNSLAEAQMKILIENIMKILEDSNITSVSIPCISTGIFYFPIRKAALIISKTIKSFIQDNPTFINKTIVFCNYDEETTETFKEIALKIFKEETKVNKNNEDKDDDNKDNEESNDSKEICKKCSKIINEKKHQSNGRHLTTCYK